MEFGRKKEGTEAVASTFYKEERGTNVYSDNATIWTGYVGLMYPSDYGYAVGTSVRNNCLTTTLSNYSNNSCNINNWLYVSGTSQWTISSRSDSANVIYLYSSGTVHGTGNAASDLSVRPVVYLNPDIEVISGDGTIDNPYIIKKG